MQLALQSARPLCRCGVALLYDVDPWLVLVHRIEYNLKYYSCTHYEILTHFLILLF